jgi:hypothetical protein
MQDQLPIYFKMMEECISLLGLDPAILKGEKDGQWNLQKGSAPVWVDIFYDAHNQCNYVQVISPVVEVPQERKLEFYEEVMKISHTLYGVGFTQYDKWVYIKAIRECENIQPSEMSAMLNRVGTYADQYDDELKNKYHTASFRKSDD